jgi:hypothetical protein
VSVPARRSIVDIGSCPTIRDWIIPSACVESVGAVITTPDDHFAASPDSRVVGSAFGRIGGSRRLPTIRAGIVFPSCVFIVKTTPDDHFTAAPYSRVSSTGRRSIAGTRS